MYTKLKEGLLLFWRGKAFSSFSALKVDEVREVQETKWIMAEVEKGDEEEEGGGREKSRSPLWCSCRGSGTADIIHLIGSYRLRGISFLFYWAKGSECGASSLLLSQQSL